MDLTMQSTCGTYGQACIAMTRDTHISKKKILALFFILICSLTTLSGCRTSGQNDKLSNSSDPIINEQELFYGEVKNPDEMFSIVAFYNNYLVYLTFDQNNQAGISRFDMSEGKAVELCKLDDYLMNPANNAILDGKLYLNYMANDSSRKMLEIDINTAAVDIIVAEDNIAGLVYCAATSECVFSLKHTTGGLSIVERYIPETKTNDNFLTFESNRSVCAISVYGEQLYVLLCDETGEYYIVQYSNDGEQMDTWKISFANDILQDSQVGWFQIIDNAFYLMNLSGQSAAFHMDGTLIDELSDWSIATITAGSFSKYAFFCRESNLDIAIYDISKEAPVEFQVCKEETNSIRYIYSDYNNPQRLLISLRNEVTGSESISVICICFLAENKSAEQMVVDRLNEAVSHYKDMNIKDDQTYSLKVSDAQMLVTTYRPEYTIFGISTNEYTVRPNQINEALTVEQEHELPICDFEYLLLYDEKVDQFYSVKFEAKKGRPVIPDFTEATKLYNGTNYELELPDTDSIESITLKKDADPSTTIGNRDDIEKILDALGNTAPTTVNGEIGTPVRVEEIINVDFNSGGTMIGRLFLYEESEKYFIEQTGNGVYSISQETYALIENYVRS